MNSTQSTLIRWTRLCSQALGSYFDACQPLSAGTPTVRPEQWGVVQLLNVNCQLTSESCFLLISQARLWDAEVLLRSVVEGTFKLVYLCTGNDAERQVKLREYWDDFPEINRIKTHQRLQQFLQQVDNPGADTWRPFQELLLEADVLSELQRQYPRQMRQQLDHRWSFNELARIIELPELPTLNLTALAFNYGLSSHFIHQDADALRLAKDRVEREPERREALELAHAGREISDLITLAAMRAMFLHRLHGAPVRPVVDLYDAQQFLFVEIEQARQRWHSIEYGGSSREL